MRVNGPLRFLPILLVLAAAVIAAAIVFPDSGALSQSATTVVALARMEIGAKPTDFDFARTGQGGPGVWIVLADSTVAEGRVIEQSSKDRTDYRFPLAIFNSVAAKDVSVS